MRGAATTTVPTNFPYDLLRNAEFCACVITHFCNSLSSPRLDGVVYYSHHDHQKWVHRGYCHEGECAYDCVGERDVQGAYVSTTRREGGLRRTWTHNSCPGCVSVVMINDATLRLFKISKLLRYYVRMERERVENLAYPPRSKRSTQALFPHKRPDCETTSSMTVFPDTLFVNMDARTTHSRGDGVRTLIAENQTKCRQ